MNEANENLAEGSLMSHLLELRDRLLRSMIAIVVCALPCLFFANELFDFFAKPIVDKLPKGASLIATSIVAPFMTPFKLALFVGLFAAMPYALYQLWAFVAPGLYRREKRFAMPLLVSSIVLFYVGAAFAYLFVFPVMFEFFIQTAPKAVTVNPDIASYLDFMLTMFLCFGLAFEVPIAVVLLATTGMVGVDKLGANRGYVAIGICIVAAILTPPDGVSMLIMAIPMYLLYEGGLIMARIMVKMRANDAAKRAAEEEAEV